MINNPETIPMTYRCNKRTADYLIYEKKIPLLGVKDGVYFFTHNYATYRAIKELPLWLKINNFVDSLIK